MSERPPRSLARSDIRRSFNGAANTYDQFAVLQRAVDERLCARLNFVQLNPQRIVDLGAGTGMAARRLQTKYTKAQMLLIDLAPAMLQRARAQRRRWRSRELYVCADATALALQSGTADLIYSNLMLQWCEDLVAVFGECRRCLRPGGLLLFSTLGPNTLKELRAAWATVDARPHVNVFLDMHDVGDQLIKSGFTSPVLEREDLTLTYQNALALMRDLKGIGARNAHLERARGMTGKATLTAVQAGYEPFRRQGALPATYEVVYGHAWAPMLDSRLQDGSTVATFPFNRLTRRGV